jgi:putative aldouronate transport system substrate-binding protein
MKGKMKRVLALSLSVLMMFVVLTACGNSTSSSSDTSTVAASTVEASTAAASTVSTSNAPDISKEVSLKWMYHGSTVTDDKAVMEKINTYLKDKINAKLEMVWCTWGDFDDRVKLAINGGDAMDIYFTCSWSADEYGAYFKEGCFCTT